jgi:metal-responsive CopG/Arc/MetJ family transcriptional regulator
MTSTAAETPKPASSSLHVRLPTAMLLRLDRLVDEHCLLNRSEALRHAISVGLATLDRSGTAP